jgi:hypothetical protein
MALSLPKAPKVECFLACLTTLPQLNGHIAGFLAYLSTLSQLNTLHSWFLGLFNEIPQLNTPSVFSTYLKTLPQLNALCRVKLCGKLERLWRKSVVTYFKLLSHYFPRGTEENPQLRHRRLPDREANMTASN